MTGIQLITSLVGIAWASVAAAQDNTNAAQTYPFPAENVSVVGTAEQRILRYEDTIARVARHEGVGFDALRWLNPSVDPWLPGDGTKISLPNVFVLPDAPRTGIVINLSERRLYYFNKRESVLAVFPVGIGTEANATPVLITRTVTKIENPSWTPPPSVRQEHLEKGEVLPAIVPAGPDNPLGDFAIQLAVPGIFIHGTNRPLGVGQEVSHGCIRLYADHIEYLVRTVPNGTQVHIVRQPFKAGWYDGSLHLESHARDSREFTGAVAAILKVADSQPVNSEEEASKVDWDRIMEVARAARGIPERVSPN